LQRSLRQFLGLLVAAGVSGACGPRAEETVILQRPDTSLCHQTPLFVEVKAGGGYALNSAPMDSAALGAWLQTTLPQRRQGERAVFVGVDSGRGTDDLRWIVAGIERAGGRAYAAVPVCVYTISQRKLPNKRLKLAARVDYGMTLSAARRSLSAIR